MEGGRGEGGRNEERDEGRKEEREGGMEGGRERRRGRGQKSCKNVMSMYAQNIYPSLLCHTCSVAPCYAGAA